MLLRVEEMTPAFYEFLGANGGEPRPWRELCERAGADPAAFEDVEVFVLFLGGSPAAWFELDRGPGGGVELRHAGVLDGFAGRGLERHILARALEAAWEDGTEVVWVEVSDGDPPGTLLAYQRAGFTVGV
jgi:GNAT superfamily N-acetyltransferase